MREILYVGLAALALLLPVKGDVQAFVRVAAPQTVIIVACQVDDLTGLPGRPDPTFAARGWRDLELHVDKNQEFVCKRERLDLEDGAYYGVNTPKEMIHLTPNFGDWTQCARVGVMQAADWNAQNPGWGVVAVGCPTPIVNDKGEVVGWTLPGCPTYLPGTNSRMKCRFDASAI